MMNFQFLKSLSPEWINERRIWNIAKVFSSSGGKGREPRNSTVKVNPYDEACCVKTDFHWLEHYRNGNLIEINSFENLLYSQTDKSMTMWSVALDSSTIHMKTRAVHVLSYTRLGKMVVRSNANYLYFVCIGKEIHEKECHILISFTCLSEVTQLHLC